MVETSRIPRLTDQMPAATVPTTEHAAQFEEAYRRAVVHPEAARRATHGREQEVQRRATHRPWRRSVRGGLGARPTPPTQRTEHDPGTIAPCPRPSLRWFIAGSTPEGQARLGSIWVVDG